MYCLRFLIVVLQELQCVPNCLQLVSLELLVSITSPNSIALHLLVSEIPNVLPEVLLLLYKIYIVYILQCLQ